MSSLKYTRGSEWRRWDLQIHTPYSALNNGFGSDFKIYAKALFDRAVASRIAAIGVTDYFLIDGYKELRDLINDPVELEALVGAETANKVQQILFLPNIEFRTSVIIVRPNGNDSRVNFHVVFSNDIAPM